MKARLTTFVFATALAVVFVGLGVAAAAFANGGYGGGHTPVTICHKPGTPAEQTLVVDDDSVKLAGHLGHGDTRGPCGGGETTPTDTTPTDTTPTDTTPTDTTPTTPTETTPTQTTPTEPTPTTPAAPRCPAGEGPYDGKDGDENEPGHNDECCPDQNGNQVCDYKESTPTPAKEDGTLSNTQPSAQSTQATPAAQAASAPAKVVKAKKAKIAAKSAHVKVKLTGDPKVDRCKEEYGLFECQPGGPGTPTITVVPGNG